MGETTKLKLNPKPVNKITAKVAFYRGEHYTAQKRSGGLVAKTWRYPPDVLGRPPEGEPNFKGERNGRMVAAYWYRPHKRGAIWIVRCACGNFEARILPNWDIYIPGRWRGKDCCEHCKDTDEATRTVQPRNGKASKRTFWAEQMLALGLAPDEIARVIDSGISTHGKTADQIRDALSQAHNAGLSCRPQGDSK